VRGLHLHHFSLRIDHSCAQRHGHAHHPPCYPAAIGNTAHMLTDIKLDAEQFDQLFEDFFNPDLNEFALCKAHSLTIAQLYQIFLSEIFRKAVKALEAVRAMRAEFQASLVKRDALAQLHNLTHVRAPNAGSVESSRKACMALLKELKDNPISDPLPIPKPASESEPVGDPLPPAQPASPAPPSDAPIPLHPLTFHADNTPVGPIPAQPALGEGAQQAASMGFSRGEPPSANGASGPCTLKRISM
jgi:hypothetical protein